MPNISRGATLNELMASVRDHARKDHGMTEIDESLKQELLQAIKER